MSRRAPNRRLRSASVWIVAIALLCVLIILDRSGITLPEAARNDLERYHQQMFTVVRVVDGDTLDIDCDDLTTGEDFTRVRLWGIDSPELPYRDRPGEPWAKRAAARARELADGRSVQLTLETYRLRGNYGRVLAHVHFTDGGSLNQILLEEGFAEADDRWPHEHLRTYAAAEQRARQAKRGMWSGK